jgi:hypothetical protein
MRSTASRNRVGDVMRFLTAFRIIKNFVIPEKSLFSALAEKCDFIRNPIWFFAIRNQMGFRTNFLSRKREEEILRNDAVLEF